MTNFDRDHRRKVAEDLEKLSQEEVIEKIRENNDWSIEGQFECTIEVEFSDFASKSSIRQWLISSGVQATHTSEILLDKEEKVKMYEMRLIPWHGVAVRLDQVGSEGTASCFLPFEYGTGIPVDINGFFELAENRRSLSLQGDVMNKAKVKEEWNQALLRDIARRYANLLLGLIEEKRSPQFIYSAFPSLETVSTDYRVIAEQAYRALIQERVSNFLSMLITVRI